MVRAVCPSCIACWKDTEIQIYDPLTNIKDKPFSYDSPEIVFFFLSQVI